MDIDDIRLIIEDPMEQTLQLMKPFTIPNYYNFNLNEDRMRATERAKVFLIFMNNYITRENELPEFAAFGDQMVNIYPQLNAIARYLDRIILDRTLMFDIGADERWRRVICARIIWITNPNEQGVYVRRHWPLNVG